MRCDMEMLILYESYKSQENIKSVSGPPGTTEIIQSSFYFGGFEGHRAVSGAAGIEISESL